MSETVKKPNQSPESYSPKKPDILNMAEALCAEKIIDIVNIEGIDFEIVNKAKTLYAGAYSVAPDNDSEPDIEGNWKNYQCNKQKIVDSITPDCMICISIGYANHDHTYPLAMAHGQESTSYCQPEGIHVIEAPPSMFIKVKATDEAWRLTKKLTGMDNPKWHMAPLFALIKHIFCNDKYSFEYNSNGNNEMEYYFDNGTACVYVPVKKRSM